MNGIEKLNKGLQDIFKLLAARNKVLYENSAGWLSGSVTVPDVDKYKEFDVYVWNTINPVRCYLINGIIRGEGLAQGVSSARLHTSVAINVRIDKNILTLNLVEVMHHGSGTNHGVAFTDMPIVKIIGVEPIPAKILSGGGALLNRLFAPLMRLDRGCVAW